MDDDVGGGLEIDGAGVQIISIINACHACFSTVIVIRHGITGYLCDPVEPDAQAFADASRRLHTLDRAQCRLDVEQRFGVEGIAQRLLDALQSLVAGKSTSSA